MSIVSSSCQETMGQVDIAGGSVAFLFNNPAMSVLRGKVRSLLLEPTTKSLTSRAMRAEILGFAGDTLTGASTTACGDILAQLIEKAGRRRRQIQQQGGGGGQKILHCDMHKGGAVDDPSLFFRPQQQQDDRTADNNNKDDDYDFVVAPLDLRRTKSYAIFGAAYTGAFQHFLFSTLHRRVEDPMIRLTINQGMIIPILYYPLLKWIVPKLRGRTNRERQELRRNIQLRKMIPKNWAYWIPLQFLQFCFLPRQYHVTYVSMVGLLWTIILSWLTAGNKNGGQQQLKEESQRFHQQQHPREIVVTSVDSAMNLTQAIYE